MAYNPTSWQNGDTITAEKLNNMETGISDANPFYIVNFTADENDMPTTTDTYANIYSQYESGKFIIFNAVGQLGFASFSDDAFYAEFTMSNFTNETLSGISVRTLLLDNENQITARMGSITA